MPKTVGQIFGCGSIQTNFTSGRSPCSTNDHAAPFSETFSRRDRLAVPDAGNGGVGLAKNSLCDGYLVLASATGPGRSRASAPGQKDWLPRDGAVMGAKTFRTAGRSTREWTENARLLYHSGYRWRLSEAPQCLRAVAQGHSWPSLARAHFKSPHEIRADRRRRRAGDH